MDGHWRAAREREKKVKNLKEAISVSDRLSGKIELAMHSPMFDRSYRVFLIPIRSSLIAIGDLPHDE